MGIHRRDLDETPFRDGSTPIKHHVSIIFVRFKATCSKCSVHVSINNTQWPNANLMTSVAKAKVRGLKLPDIPGATCQLAGNQLKDTLNLLENPIPT